MLIMEGRADQRPMQLFYSFTPVPWTQNTKYVHTIHAQKIIQETGNTLDHTYIY
jgi:hypothetical protein